MKQNQKKHYKHSFAALFAAAFFTCLSSLEAVAQESSSPPEPQNIPYNQSFANFDDLENLPAGWSLDDEYSYLGSFGSGATGGLRGEGALGFQLTASGLNSSFAASLTLVNNTGTTINGLMVSYTGKVARVDQDGTPHWIVSVNGITHTELEYSTADGIDKQVSHLISDLVIEAGENLLIEWATTQAGTTGTRRQIGITDVHIHSADGPLPPAPPTESSFVIPYLDEDVEMQVAFEPIDYQLFLSKQPEGGGTVTASPQQEVYHINDLVMLTASPNPERFFTGWSGDTQFLDDPGEEEVLLTMPAQDVSLTANFSGTRYLIQFGVDGENGVIDATANGEIIESGDEVEKGSEVIFNATPGEGYRIKHWIINGEVVEPENEGALLIHSLETDLHVMAKFEEVTTGAPPQRFIASTEDVLLGPGDGHACYDATKTIFVPGQGFFLQWQPVVA